MLHFVHFHNHYHRSLLVHLLFVERVFHCLWCWTFSQRFWIEVEPTNFPFFSIPPLFPFCLLFYFIFFTSKYQLIYSVICYYLLLFIIQSIIPLTYFLPPFVEVGDVVAFLATETNTTKTTTKQQRGFNNNNIHTKHTIKQYGGNNFNV